MGALASLLPALLGAAVSIFTAKKQAKAANESNAIARQNMAANEARALKQEQENDQAMNRANQKKPNTAAILAAAQQAGKGGIGGTLLTGPSGVPDDLLSLGKTGLLGQ